MADVLTKRTVGLVNAGGTIGMRANDGGRLVSVSPSELVGFISRMPGFLNERDALVLRLPSVGNPTDEIRLVPEPAFDKPPDSSAMTPEKWAMIAEAVRRVQQRQHLDGVVVLHGTDTMAWTASAVSFLLGSVDHPVVFTGAQLPLVYSRTDGLRNLVTAIEFAAKPETPHEVAVLFDQVLLRGNRTTKATVSSLGAFDSPNCRPLAQAGTVLRPSPDYREPRALSPVDLIPWRAAVGNVQVLVHRMYPGCRNFPRLPDEKVKVAAVLEAFGAGTACPDNGLRTWVDQLVERDAPIVLRSQVPHGAIDAGLYEASDWLSDVGVISGVDITSEACVAKLFYLLARTDLTQKRVRELMTESIRGEVSLSQPATQGSEVGIYPEEVYTLKLRDRLEQFFPGKVQTSSFIGSSYTFDIVFESTQQATRVGVEIKFGVLHRRRVEDVLRRFEQADPVELILLLSDDMPAQTQLLLANHEPRVIWMSRMHALGMDWEAFVADHSPGP